MSTGLLAETQAEGAVAPERGAPTSPNRHVRTDVIVGAALIGVTLLGRLLWQASDAGFFDTFAAR